MYYSNLLRIVDIEAPRMGNPHLLSVAHWLVRKISKHKTPPTMIAAAARTSAARSMSLGARRTLVASARSFQDPIVKPGTPVTAQPVKAQIHTPKPVLKADIPPKAEKPAPAVVEKVKEINEGQEVPKKSSFSFTGFLFKTAVLTSLLYGITLYAATKNEKVMDFVIDKQLPYYEELIEVIENGSVEDLQEKLVALQAKFKLPSKDQIGELTSKLEHQGEQLIQETKKKLKVTQKSSNYTTPAEQLQKPVEIEPTHDVEKLPLIQLKDVAHIADESVKKTITSFNELIAMIDASAVGSKKDTLIKSITENINALSTKLSTLNTNLEKEVQAKLKGSQTELLASYTQKELELTQNLLDQYHLEKTQLEKKYADLLVQEVEAAKHAISQAAVNATSMVRIEQTSRFEKLIKLKIDNERNGRLNNLEALNARLDQLESFADLLQHQVSAAASKTLVQQALTKLKSMLTASSDTPARFVQPYVALLETACKQADDEVMTLAINELKPLLDGESNQSLLTIPQLQASWEVLAPELRAAALLPPNAGLLGHIASRFFSKLLMPVKGSKPDGRDIESVIGRVDQSLARGQLDVAVEEVASLKGWSRRVADDWVCDGRKRLEAEFLVSLLDAEAKIL